MLRRRSLHLYSIHSVIRSFIFLFHIFHIFQFFVIFLTPIGINFLGTLFNFTSYNLYYIPHSNFILYFCLNVNLKKKKTNSKKKHTFCWIINNKREIFLFIIIIIINININNNINTLTKEDTKPLLVDFFVFLFIHQTKKNNN